MKKYKGIIALIIIVIALVFVYMNYFSGDDPNELLVAEGLNVQNIAVGRGLLSVLLDLRGLKLDSSIFDDTNFQSLRDFSVEIQPQKSGRSNPFLPIN